MSNVFRHATLPAALALLSLAAPALAQFVTPRVSPNASVSQTIGVTDVTVKYCRPGVKGRVIWGGLVPKDKPWRTGANEATSFTVTHDVTVNGKPLAAGTYALLTIPGEKDWQVVFNSDKDLWGAYEYKPEHDVLRVTATPKPAEHEEWMRFAFENLTPSSADLVLRWETLELPVTIAADVNGIMLASAREAVTQAKADDWRTPYQAARWGFDNGQALEEAAKWLEKSLTVQTTFANLGLKARWLAKDGKTQDAIAAGRKAVELGKASPDKPDTAPLEKSIAEWGAVK